MVFGSLSQPIPTHTDITVRPGPTDWHMISLLVPHRMGRQSYPFTVVSPTDRAADNGLLAGPFEKPAHRLKLFGMAMAEVEKKLVDADGKVSYLHPECWYRAYLRKHYDAAETTVKSRLERLAKTLGAGKAFGGDVDADSLPNYRYMFGLERSDDSGNALATFASFEEDRRARMACKKFRATPLAKKFSLCTSHHAAVGNPPASPDGAVRADRCRPPPARSLH